MIKPYYEKPGFKLYHANSIDLLKELEKKNKNFADIVKKKKIKGICRSPLALPYKKLLRLLKLFPVNLFLYYS